MYRRRYNRGGNRQEVENAMSSLDIFRYCPCCGSSRYISNSFKSKKCEDCGFEQFLIPSAAYVALIRDAEGRLLVTRRLLVKFLVKVYKEISYQLLKVQQFQLSMVLYRLTISYLLLLVLLPKASQVI